MSNFSMLGHWMGDKFQYELQIQNGEKLDTYIFKALKPVEKITTLQEAQMAKCKCTEMGDIPGISRLFGEFSEPSERELAFLDFEGVTKDKQVYMPMVKGEVDVIKTENGTQMNFKSDKINGRWLLRELPNIFENGFIEGDKMQLFWKPDNKETMMSDKLQMARQIPLANLKGPQEKVLSELQSDISISSNSREFETVVAAEGTWIDKFGQKFTYTKEFINTLFSNMNMQLLEGTIPIGVDKEHNKMDNGKMTKLELLDQPIAHIKGRGFFNGNIGDVKGASIDAELDAVFLPEFQSWFPVNGVTKRVSLVANPACKVCHFIPEKAG